jgi:virginiamycin B lyase
LWFAEQAGDAIGRITTAGVATEFTAGITRPAAPFGITLGPDGNLWFTEITGNRIGRITTGVLGDVIFFDGFDGP